MDAPEALSDSTVLGGSLAGGQPPAPVGPSLDPAEALERLRRGESIENARVVRLKLTGKFPLPVRFRTLASAITERLAKASTRLDEISKRLVEIRLALNEKSVAFREATRVIKMTNPLPPPT